MAIRRQMLDDSPWSFSSSPEGDRGLDAEHLRQTMASVDAAVMGVRGADGLVAAATTTREVRAKRRHVAWVMGVFVVPEMRGRGLGAAVVGACVEHARAWEGVTQVQLGVSASSPAARRLYERLGFVAWGIEREALRVGGVWHDEVHMALRL